MSQNDDSVARMLVVDVGVRSLLIGEARRRAVTRVFGPRDCFRSMTARAG